VTTMQVVRRERPKRHFDDENTRGMKRHEDSS